MRTIVLTIFAGLIFISDVCAQSVTRMMRISAEGASLFGENIQLLDVTGDNLKDIFVGAPGNSFNSAANAGMIYLLTTPFNEGTVVTNSRDSVITNESAIIAGKLANARLGRMFKLGYFNGDAIADLAVSYAETDFQLAGVGIFFGPFSKGNIRTEPDVYIEAGEVGSNFGTSIDVFPANASDRRNMLIVSDNGFSSGGPGEILFFAGIDGTQPLLTRSNARSVLSGGEPGSLFGSSVAVLGDVNGDGRSDIGFTAPNSSNSGFKRGSVRVYFGPFAEGNISYASANVVFNGITNARSWGSRLFAFGDVNKDGLADFAFSSTEEERLALAVGRRNWASNVQISVPTNPTDTLVFFSRFNSSTPRGTGISADFTGDYNKDGILDPIVGVRGDPEGPAVGAAVFYFLNGAPRQIFANGAVHQFTAQMYNSGNISSNDPYKVDDIVIGSPRENASAGMIYIYRGAINPPVITFNTTPGNLEIGQTLNLNIEWAKGSREVREVRLIRLNGLVRDTTRFKLSEGNRFLVQQTYSQNLTLTFTAEVIDDLLIKVAQNRTVQVAAYPKAFSLVSDFTTPVSVSGARTQNMTFNWVPSADTNARRVTHQVLVAQTPEALELTAPSTGKFSLGTSLSGALNVPFTTLRTVLLQTGTQLNQTKTLYWTVYANNGIFFKTADGGPRTFQATLGNLDNEMLITGNSRSMTINGFLADNILFSWGALSSDQADQIVRYEFQVLGGGTNTSPILFSNFSANNGFAREFRLTNEHMNGILRGNGLLGNAQGDSARLFFTVRALINESSYWHANNGPKRLGVKYIRIIDLPVSNELDSERPKAFSVLQNYPNPFNPETTVPFGIPEAGAVTIDVVNVLGQRVYSWSSSGNLPAGWHKHSFQAVGFSSGVYMIRVRFKDNVIIRKTTLLK